MASHNIPAFILKKHKPAQEKSRERLINSKRPFPIHPNTARIQFNMLKGILQWVRWCQAKRKHCCMHNGCENEKVSIVRSSVRDAMKLGDERLYRHASIMHQVTVTGKFSALAAVAGILPKWG